MNGICSLSSHICIYSYTLDNRTNLSLIYYNYFNQFICYGIIFKTILPLSFIFSLIMSFDIDLPSEIYCLFVCIKSFIILNSSKYSLCGILHICEILGLLFIYSESV